MGKKGKRPPSVATSSSALTHNPFAALAGRVGEEEPAAAAAPGPCDSPAPLVDSSPQLRFPAKIVIRREMKGRGGKTVTRLSGIPEQQLTEVARRLRRALGCGATVEGEDVLLQGALEERAWAWLLSNGAKRVAKSSPPGRRTNPERPAASAGPEPAGTIRANVRRGVRVAIVLKEHQRSGELTVGVVDELLTRSARHPRGIKVRLESGQVGRVHRIL